MVETTHEKIYVRFVKPIAISYGRFSTPEQRKGNSSARQWAASEKYAREHGYVLDNALSCFDKGLSGYKGDHLKKGNLGKFLELVRAGRVPKGSLLIVEALDRLSRETIYAQMSLLMELINNGITVVTLIDGYSYAKDSFNEREFMMSITAMSMAHRESATKSVRLKSAWAAKRKSDRILTGRAPAWLTTDRRKNVFGLIPERVALIQQIFAWAEEGNGQNRIAKILNQRKEPTWGKGDGWHSSYVEKILENRAVLGEFQPHRMEGGKRVPDGDVKSNYFPQIVSVELFYRVNSKRKANARFVGRSSNNRNLFSGLLKCGYSGSSVVFVNKGHWQYLVSDRARRGLGGKYVSWTYADFETSFFTFLNELNFADLLDQDSLNKVRENTNAIAIKEGEIETLNRRQIRLLEAISATELPVKALADEMARIQQQQNSAILELERLKAKRDQQSASHKNAEAAQAENKTLIARRTDPEIRELIRRKLRDQVELIEIFSEGLPVNPVEFNDLALALGEEISRTAEFTQVPQRIRTNMKELLGRNFSTTPRGKEERYFKVHFKTGSTKVVKPNFENPALYQLLMTGTNQPA